MTMAQQQQSPAAGVLVVLYTLDLTVLGGSVLNFTPAVDGSGNPISWGGVEYSPIPMEADGFERSSQGAAGRPTLTVSNVMGELAGLARLYNGFRDAPLTRTRTFAAFLDGGGTPDADAALSHDTYIVHRLLRQDHEQMQWELRNALDREGARLPAKQALTDTCQQRYRLWNGSGFSYGGGVMQCPYVGGVYFTADDVQTWLPQEDDCGHQLTSCRARHGAGIPLPFGGFPHLGRGRY